MISKKLTTLAFAGAATLGALALSVESASARPGHGGFHRHGFHRHVGFHRHGWRHRHWRGYGWGFAPIVVGTSYAVECYWIRRYGALIRVCD